MELHASGHGGFVKQYPPPPKKKRRKNRVSLFGVSRSDLGIALAGVQRKVQAGSPS